MLITCKGITNSLIECIKETEIYLTKLDEETTTTKKMKILCEAIRSTKSCIESTLESYEYVDNCPFAKELEIQIQISEQENCKSDSSENITVGKKTEVTCQEITQPLHNCLIKSADTAREFSKETDPTIIKKVLCEAISSTKSCIESTLESYEYVDNCPLVKQIKSQIQISELKNCKSDLSENITVGKKTEVTCQEITQPLHICLMKGADTARELSKETDPKKMKKLECEMIDSTKPCLKSIFESNKVIDNCPLVKQIKSQIQISELKNCKLDSSEIITVGEKTEVTCQEITQPLHNCLIKSADTAREFSKETDPTIIKKVLYSSENITVSEKTEVTCQEITQPLHNCLIKSADTARKFSKETDPTKIKKVLCEAISSTKSCIESTLESYEYVDNCPLVKEIVNQIQISEHENCKSDSSENITVSEKTEVTCQEITLPLHNCLIKSADTARKFSKETDPTIIKKVLCEAISSTKSCIESTLESYEYVDNCPFVKEIVNQILISEHENCKSDSSENITVSEKTEVTCQEITLPLHNCLIKSADTAREFSKETDPTKIKKVLCEAISSTKSCIESTLESYEYVDNCPLVKEIVNQIQISEHENCKSDSSENITVSEKTEVTCQEITQPLHNCLIKSADTAREFSKETDPTKIKKVLCEAISSTKSCIESTLETYEYVDNCPLVKEIVNQIQISEHENCKSDSSENITVSEKTEVTCQEITLPLHNCLIKSADAARKFSKETDPTIIKKVLCEAISSTKSCIESTLESYEYVDNCPLVKEIVNQIQISEHENCKSDSSENITVSEKTEVTCQEITLPLHNCLIKSADTAREFSKETDPTKIKKVLCEAISSTKSCIESTLESYEYVDNCPLVKEIVNQIQISEHENCKSDSSVNITVSEKTEVTCQEITQPLHNLPYQSADTAREFSKETDPTIIKKVLCEAISSTKSCIESTLESYEYVDNCPLVKEIVNQIQISEHENCKSDSSENITVSEKTEVTCQEITLPLHNCLIKSADTAREFSKETDPTIIKKVLYSSENITVSEKTEVTCREITPPIHNCITENSHKVREFTEETDPKKKKKLECEMINSMKPCFKNIFELYEVVDNCSLVKRIKSQIQISELKNCKSDSSENITVSEKTELTCQEITPPIHNCITENSHKVREFTEETDPKKKKKLECEMINSMKPCFKNIFELYEVVDNCSLVKRIKSQIQISELKNCKSDLSENIPVDEKTEVTCQEITPPIHNCITENSHKIREFTEETDPKKKKKLECEMINSMKPCFKNIFELYEVVDNCSLVERIKSQIQISELKNC
ncbi:hypothetical protein GQR58_024406 [Nymphon striatum]|nr:hypothetical protein GQR58_024406 [Nymphon striatum]